MRKFSLQGSKKMYVEQAATWSRELTRMRARGPGDTENAMRALERDYGIDYWTTWRLRYRVNQIKDIGIEAYARIAAAYQSECERQRRKLAAELEITKSIAGAAHPAVIAAQALVGED